MEQSTRSRVKQALELQQRRFETDLINLKDKQEKATAATEKKPTATASSTANRTYTKEITGYGNDRYSMFSFDNILSFSMGSIG